MTTEEQQKFDALEKQVSSINPQLNTVSRNIELIMVALTGSELSKDGGLIARVVNIEKTVEQVENEFNERLDIFEQSVQKQIAQMKLKQQKNETFVRIIWGLTSAVLTAIVIFIVTQVIDSIKETKQQHKLQDQMEKTK